MQITFVAGMASLSAAACVLALLVGARSSRRDSGLEMFAASLALVLMGAGWLLAQWAADRVFVVAGKDGLGTDLVMIDWRMFGLSLLGTGMLALGVVGGWLNLLTQTANVLASRLGGKGAERLVLPQDWVQAGVEPDQHEEPDGDVAEGHEPEDDEPEEEEPEEEEHETSDEAALVAAPAQTTTRGA